MSNEKIYCGSAKRKEFSDGGNIMNVSLDLDELNKRFKVYGFETRAGKKIIKLKISKRREPDQYDNTHSVMIDTWKPENQESQTPSGGQGFGTPRQESAPPSLDNNIKDDEIPW